MRSWLLLAVLAAGCRGDAISAAHGRLRLAPPVIDLGEVATGQPVTVRLEAHNDGRAPLELSWSTSDEALRLVEPLTLLAGGANARITAALTPAADGPVEVEVEASSGDQRSTVQVRAAAVAHPCVPSSACVSSAWSSALRRCEETPLPDGASCDPQTACIEAPRCTAGQCTGHEVSCDDGDACTTDLCDARAGCLHVPAPPCPGDGRCLVGVCNPARGCGLAPAADGTVCGRHGCAVADVCLDGACVERDPPDGFVCAEASPCQLEGHCAGDVCVRPPAATLAPSWDVGAPQPDGGPPEMWSDVLLTATSDVILSSYFMSPPRLGAASPSPVNLRSAARRCLTWDDLLVCADYPGDAPAGVSALDPASGALRWTYDRVLDDLPALVAPDKNTFLARLAVLAPNRLAATFETRRLAADGADMLCRTFSVVVLDRQGTRRASWILQDPLFDRCVHPHSFGVAADTAGNLFYAFTPSLQSNPATPATTETLLASYTPTGQLRWKRTEPGLPGGELAVALGALLHAHSPTAWSTATGAPLATLPGPFRSGVATRDALIPGPASFTSTLSAVSPTSFAHRWSYALPPNAVFVSDQTRLASWTTPRGTSTVLLAVERSGGVQHLLAIDASTGVEAFSCPLSLLPAPLTMEVGAGGLAVMTTWTTPSCGACDPRWAWTKNEFLWFQLPGVERATAPWTGTHGGAGHDHQEDPVPGSP